MDGDVEDGAPAPCGRVRAAPPHRGLLYNLLPERGAARWRHCRGFVTPTHCLLSKSLHRLVDKMIFTRSAFNERALMTQVCLNNCLPYHFARVQTLEQHEEFRAKASESVQLFEVQHGLKTTRSGERRFLPCPRVQMPNT